jgi:hypothetical protein
LLYLFEDYALDTDRRELRRGAALLSMEPQVFDLLAFLVGVGDPGAGHRPLQPFRSRSRAQVELDDAALAVYADSQFRYRKAASDVAEMRH